MRLLRKLWGDDCGGGLLSSELLFLYTTLVLGGVSGMVAMRQALVVELVEAAQSLLALNQGYSYSGQKDATTATTPGSSASDATNTITLGSTAASQAAVGQTPMD